MDSTAPAADSDPIDPGFTALLQQYSAAVEAGDAKLAEETSLQIMEAAAQSAAGHLLDENSPEDRSLQLDLAADEAQAAGNWDAARAIYEDLLNQAIASGEVHQQARRNMRLALVGLRAGDLSGSYESAREGVTAAREFGVMSLLAMACTVFASVSRRQRRFGESVTALDEALASLQDTRTFDLVRGQLLTERAAALLELGDHEGAERDLQAAWHAFKFHAGFDVAPGLQSRLGDWWQVAARFRGAAKSWEQAREAWQTGLACKRRAIETWQANGWESEARIKLLLDEVTEFIDEYAATAERAGDIELARSLRHGKGL